MGALSSSMLVGNKGAGRALMAAVILTIVGSLFYPGGPLINPVNQTDFPAAIAALGDQPSLGHVTTMLAVAGMLLQAYGLFALFRLSNGQRCLAGTALRTGVIASLFGWGIFLLALGRRHMVIHLMQRSMNPAETPEVQAQFQAFALAGHVDMAGLLLGFLWVYPIASILVGLGLAARFGALDIFKAASYGLVIIGAAGLINFVVAQHAPTLDLNILLVLNNVFLMVGALCLFVIGLGLYQGRRELVPEDSSG